MKRLFIYLCISIGILSAKTIIVDKNMMCMPFFGCMGACENGDKKYKTISDALSNANNDDIIKICPGTYEENDLKIKKSHLVITSTSNNKKDVTITNKNLRTKKNIFSISTYIDGLSLKNLTLYQDSSTHSIVYASRYIKNINFNNLSIDSKGRGIYLERGIENINIDNVDIDSSKNSVYLKRTNKDIIFTDINFTTKNSSSPAIVISDWSNVTIDTNKRTLNEIKANESDAIHMEEGNFVIRHTKVDAKNNGIYFSKYISKLEIYDTNISANERGIAINRSTQNTNINNVNIVNAKYGVYVKNTDNLNIKNSEFTNLGKYGLYLEKISNNVALDNLNIIGGRYSLYGKKLQGLLEIKDSNFENPEKAGIYLKKVSRDVDIDNLKITNGIYSIYAKELQNQLNIKNSDFENPSGYGLYLEKVSNDVNIDNLKITNGVYSIYAKKLQNKLNIQNSDFESPSKYGVYVYDVNGGEIKDTIFKNAGKYGLYLLKHKKWVDFKVINNCFENGANKNIISQTYKGIFDDGSKGNYWDDWSGSSKYLVPNIPRYDNHPLTQCLLHTTSKPVIDYRMDECTWDNNPSSYEIINYGTSGNSFNASSNGATTENNTTLNGMLCKVGNFSDNHYITTQNNISEYLNKTATLTFWIKTAQVGNDTDWRAPGVTGAEQVGGTDDIFWGWIDSKGYIHISVGNSNGAKSSIKINDNHWHFVALTRNSDTGKLQVYVDNNLPKSATDNAGVIGISYKSIGQIENTRKYFNGYLDEIKVFNKVLSKNEISNIYNYEKNRKNYDGSLRNCQSCNENISFLNAVDYIYTCNAKINWDNNITTKIDNKEFKLSILAKDKNNNPIKTKIKKVDLYVYNSFSGNKCSGSYKIINIYSGDEETDNNGCLTLNNIVYDKVSKCVVVHIESENNSSNSLDNFAIRPAKFDISDINNIYAGEEFNISYKALDDKDNNAVDYNETNSTIVIDIQENKTNCITGKYDTNISFRNGESKSIAVYDEVGDINLTIKENNLTPFASIDLGQTSNENLYITPKTIKIDSLVYKLKTNTSFNGDIIYDDMNLSHYAEVETTIQALNAKNDILKNFNKECYAQDINLSYNVQNDIVDSFVGIYQENGVDINDSKFEKWDNNWSVSYNLFINGEANKTIKFNIYKDRQTPVSIVDLNFTKLVSYIANANIKTNIENINHNFSFYYLRVFADDVYTDEVNTTSHIYVLVYDKDSDKFTNEKLINWFVDTNYSNDDIKTLGYTNSYQYDANISGFDANLIFKGYYYDVNISNPAKHHFVVIHLKTPNYLWISKYKDYNDSLNSYCLSHYCIEYVYDNSSEENNTDDVGSGEFEGSEVNVTTKKRKGIKIYR